MAGDCYKAEALPTKCMPAKEHRGEDSPRLLAIISCGSWTAAQKIQLAYHLERERGQLWMPLFRTPTARTLLLGSGLLREAWTDFGDFGVVRRAGLTKIDKFCQALSHPGVDPASNQSRDSKLVSLKNA